MAAMMNVAGILGLKNTSDQYIVRRQGMNLVVDLQVIGSCQKDQIHDTISKCLPLSEGVQEKYDYRR